MTNSLTLTIHSAVGFLACDRHPGGVSREGSAVTVRFDREQFSITLDPKITGAAPNVSLGVRCEYDPANPWPALQILSALAVFHATNVMEALARLTVWAVTTK